MKKKTAAVFSMIIGSVAGSAASMTLLGRKAQQKAKKVDKFKGYYNMLNQWLMIKQEGKTLEEYFINNGYKTIAIYGMGEMGNRLYDELKDSSIQIKYAVDENAAGTYSDIEVIDKDEEYMDVDVIVVTATFAFDDIEEELQKKVTFPIISLDDVVYEM